MPFRLGEILTKGVHEGRDKLSRYSVGWYEERRLWRELEPRSNRGWEVKDFRPFMVVDSDGDYLHLVLFTSSSFILRCRKDRKYGIENRTPEVDFGRCFIKREGHCKVIRGKGKIFKRMVEGRNCHIVLRIKRRLLEENAYTCGVCLQEALTDEIKEIFRRELEEWKCRG